MVDLSVVIVNYNGRADLQACLTALQNCQPIPEIIVVDNASRDGSAAMVRSEFPGVHLMAMDTNHWFCGGNNLGIQAAQGNYILLLNPDTVPEPDALGLMLDFLQSNTDYTGVTAQLHYPDSSIQLTCSRKTTYIYLMLEHTPLGWIFRQWRTREAARHWYQHWDRMTDNDVEVIPGSCTMIRRGISLDGDLRLYFPEDDLAARFSDARFRYLTGARILHKEKSVTQTWLATQVYFRDMFIFTSKHYGSLRAWLLWLLSRPLFWGMWLRRRR